MATCKIRIYQTHLTPARNALVDNLDDYLATLTPRYSSDNFQYQQLALDLIIKTNVKQNVISGHNLGNYLTIEQDGKTWYYFILNTEWSGQETVKLTLSIDSINTFRNDLTFNAKTSIQREHRDRLKKVEGYIARVIDYENEGLTLPKVIEDSEDVRIMNSDLDWYLMYKTADELSTTNLNNAVSCYLCASQQIAVGGGSEQERELTVNDLLEDRFYYFTGADNVGGSFKLTINGATTTFNDINGTYQMDVRKAGSITLADRQMNGLMLYRKDNKMYYGLQFTDVCSYQPVGITTDIFNQSTTVPTLPNKAAAKAAFGNYNVAECQSVSISGNFLRYGQAYYISADSAVVNLSQTLPIYAGVGATIMSFNDVDRTDSKIMKIIKLPYSPVKFNYTNGHYDFGDDWQVIGGLLKLKNTAVSKGFSNENIYDASLTEYFVNASTIDTTAVRNDYNESKLYNSSFFTYKFAYDSFAKEIKLENIRDYTTVDITVGINFKMTSTINSRFMFKFDSDGGYMYKESDYEPYLIINRNNEETIYSNDYINYMRTGYNYDQKMRNQQLTMSLLGTGFSSTSQIIAGGIQAVQGKTIPSGTKEGLPVSRAVGQALTKSSAAASIASGLGSIASNITGSLYSYVQAGQQIEQKQYELQQQATSVIGSDDLDLLSDYNGNRLKIITYKLRPEDEKMVADLFYYTGYRHAKLEKPNLESRYWFNFIQCSPVFNEEGDTPYNDYIEDVKARYESGITVYHCHNGVYDWNQELENWEVSIL